MTAAAAPERAAPPRPGAIQTGPSRRPGRPGARPERRRRWRQRWYRVVAPFAVLVLLVGITMGARAHQEPNLRSAETLAPSGTGRDGSSVLARMLTERGVQIEYVSTIDEALAAGQSGGDAVVFIPKPTIFGAVFASMAPFLPGDQRVVMVAPNNRHLRITGAPVTTGVPRWASTATAPDCRVPEAVEAGPAAVLRQRYAIEDPPRTCYDGGLVQSRIGQGLAAADLFVAGSADPFRNRRIDEHQNAALAVGLLATHDRVIWAGALPFDVNFEMPDMPGFRAPQLPEIDPPERQEADRDRPSGLSGFFYGYPPAVVAGLTLAAALALLLALVRGRRLGAPVSEPLPVLVPAAEVVAGRGRMYQRARGRGVALETLRSGALRRMLPILGLPVAPPPAPETVVGAVAGRTGLPTDYVRLILYGPAPETDEQLSQAVAALDALVEAVTHEGGSS